MIVASSLPAQVAATGGAVCVCVYRRAHDLHACPPCCSTCAFLHRLTHTYTHPQWQLSVCNVCVCPFALIAYKSAQTVDALENYSALHAKLQRNERSGATCEKVSAQIAKRCVHSTTLYVWAYVYAYGLCGCTLYIYNIRLCVFRVGVCL